MDGVVLVAKEKQTHDIAIGKDGLVPAGGDTRSGLAGLCGQCIGIHFGDGQVNDIGIGIVPPFLFTASHGE